MILSKRGNNVKLGLFQLKRLLDVSEDVKFFSILYMKNPKDLNSWIKAMAKHLIRYVHSKHL